MERITNHAPNSTKENKIGCTSFGKHACIERMGICDGCPVNEEAWARLAAYEDTGLSPDTVDDLRKALLMVRFFDSIRAKNQQKKEESLK